MYSILVENEFDDNLNLIQFINNDIFFCYFSNYLVLYKIENNKCIELNSSDLKYINSSK